MSSNPIFMLGAFDRYNFGDLLFPLLMRELLLRHETPGFTVHPLGFFREGPLERGLDTTHGFRAMAQGAANGDLRVVVGGGELLTASWWSLLQYYPHNRAKLIRASCRSLPRRFRDPLLRRALGGASPYPYMIDGAHPNAKVVYNAVGGVALERAAPERRAFVKLCFASSAYASVRDRKTHAHLTGEGVDAALTPDSVAAIWTILNRSDVYAACSPVVQDLVAMGNYFVLQVREDAKNLDPASVAEAVDDLCSRTGLTPVLLPFSRARQNDDRVFLEAVRPRLRHAHVYLPHATVNETIACVSSADCFIGTSLHGAILSIASETPLAPLGDVGKRQAYMETWAPELIVKGVDASGIGEAFRTATGDMARLMPPVAKRSQDAAGASVRTLVEAVTR